MDASLKVIQKIPFEFYGKIFDALLTENRKIYIVLKDICDHMGIDAEGQRQRILRDRAINDSLEIVSVKRLIDDSYEREQEMSCLNIETLPYWMGSIDVERIKPELMDQVLLYKREFAAVAWGVYRSSLLPADVLAELDITLPPALQTFYRLTDQVNQARIDTQDIRNQIAYLDNRISAVENRMAGVLTSKQKLDISKMVADLSRMLVAKGVCKEIGSARQRAYGGINKEFRVQSYQDIPSSQFNSVHNYLIRSWQSQFPDKPIPSSFNIQNELF